MSATTRNSTSWQLKISPPLTSSSGIEQSQVVKCTILEQRPASLSQEALQAGERLLLHQNRLCDLRCHMLFLPNAELRTQYLASQAATMCDHVSQQAYT